VINGLTNEFHPCQVLADIYTFIEMRGSIQGTTVAWIGDTNNMCYHMAASGAVARFQGQCFGARGLHTGRRTRRQAFHQALRGIRRPMDAARGADLVTTDVWTSMGFEAENEPRRLAFADWCVDEEMMQAAGQEALFMHCLPAHRGEEVTHGVMEGRTALSGTRLKTGCMPRRRCSSTS